MQIYLPVVCMFYAHGSPPLHERTFGWEAKAHRDGNVTSWVHPVGMPVNLLAVRRTGTRKKGVSLFAGFASSDSPGQAAAKETKLHKTNRDGTNACESCDASKRRPYQTTGKKDLLILQERKDVEASQAS